MTRRAPEQLQRFERELAADPELAEYILRELPALPQEPRRVTIRTDAASVDVAIGRALALAANGFEPALELAEDWGGHRT